MMGLPPKDLADLVAYYGGPIHFDELTRLKALAALAEEHASWIRRGPPLDHGNTPLDEDWLSRYEDTMKEER